MNCFVIMPFAPEFDDVYHAIKSTVGDAIGAQGGRCFRLDESRPAGRITDRLLQELRAASLCIADLTGNRPNVMWEVGFAMALGCPTILVTQNRDKLPFDICDMQTLEYDRNKLQSTLCQPLQATIRDTRSWRQQQQAVDDGQRQMIRDLLAQISDLKSMIAQAVRSWNPPNSSPTASPHELRSLEGAWRCDESGSHLYAKIIGQELVVPYCYCGNHSLTGFYTEWRKAGQYWFARYSWVAVDEPPTGFTFLRQECPETMRGAWWGDEQGLGDPVAPPKEDGVPVTWRRRNARFPRWAEQAFDKWKVGCF